jgi:hypothetical protein
MTTTTISSGSHSARRTPALWAGLALFVGGVIGASASALVIDDDSSPNQSVVSVEGSFRSASAAEADRYVDSLESRASSIGATDHGYVYAHGFNAAPETSSRMSADAAEHRAQSEAPTVGRAHPSPAAIEHRAEAQAQAQAEAQASPLDSCHGATHGVC